MIRENILYGHDEAALLQTTVETSKVSKGFIKDVNNNEIIANMYNLFFKLILFSLILNNAFGYNCSSLLMGQYLCPDPDIDHIDPKTQQIRGCTKENTATGK